jgi:hypothetical protein
MLACVGRVDRRFQGICKSFAPMALVKLETINIFVPETLAVVVVSESAVVKDSSTVLLISIRGCSWQHAPQSLRGHKTRHIIILYRLRLTTKKISLKTSWYWQNAFAPLRWLIPLLAATLRLVWIVIWRHDVGFHFLDKVDLGIHK